MENLTKEVQKRFSTTSGYLEDKDIGYVLSYSDIKKAAPTQGVLTNLHNIDALIMLANSLSLTVMRTHTPEVADNFTASLGKLVEELRALHKRRKSI